MKYDRLTRISPLPSIAALFSPLERSRLLERAEPRVSERRDRHGNPFYWVYDPQTGRSTTFGSEAEVRWWLEQRRG